MSEKTEKPTNKKLSDARKKGEIAKGQKLPIMGGLVGGFLGILAAKVYAKGPLLDVFASLIEHKMLATAEFGEILLATFGSVLAVSLPVLIGAAIGSTVATLAQTQGLVSFESMKFKFETLTGKSYFQRFSTPQPIYESLIMLAFGGLLFAIGYSVFKSTFDVWVKAYGVRPALLNLKLFELYESVLFKVCLIGLIIAVLDYVYQRQQFLKKQKMSKDEVKREYKEQEGDPMIKGTRRMLAREIANSPMQKPKLAQASMVITNPTHIAVVLYRSTDVRIPIILDIAYDEFVPGIKLECKRLGVPVFEDKPLARLIAKKGAIGAPIPRQSFAKVAHWLARAEVLNKLRPTAPITTVGTHFQRHRNPKPDVIKPTTMFQRIFKRVPRITSFWR
jgi:flagellar biosynthesis protein FliR/FlhB